MKPEKTAARPDSFLSFTFLGMLIGTVVATAFTKSLLVLIGGITLTVLFQRVFIRGFGNTGE